MYALTNRAGHPLNMTLRQHILPAPPCAWLAVKFGPRSLPATTGELAAVADTSLLTRWPRPT